MKCPRCTSTQIKKAGSITAARGRVQRFLCTLCHKKFHPSLLSMPIIEKEGYWDIETSQAGRGAGNFGIIYSWAILDRKTDDVVYDAMRNRTRSEEKRIVASMIKEMIRYDRLYTWYGTGHDVPVSRSRAVHYGLEFPAYQTLFHSDLYYAFRHRFKLHSNRQDSAAEFLGFPDQEHKLSPAIWVDAMFNDTFKASIKHITEHNIEDTHQTKFIHERIESFIAGTCRSV